MNDFIRLAVARVDVSGLPKVGVNNGDDTLRTILNIVFGLAGGMALIIISIGAFRFVTSRGNPDATAKARNTVIYAVVGLIITLVAFGIVSFVVNRI